MKSTYIVNSGKHAGKTGTMVARVCDSSNNDIKLEFDDGSQVWFNFRDVTLNSVCPRCKDTKVVDAVHKHDRFCYGEDEFGNDVLECNAGLYDQVECPYCKNW